MTGVEIAVGYVVAWVVRKVRRAAGRADAEVDRGVDAAMDYLHDVVSSRLGEDRALVRLNEEAASREEPTSQTRQWLELILGDAAEQDTAFAEMLAEAVRRVQAAEASTDSSGHAVSRNTFSGPTAFQIGDHNRQVNTFGTGK
ncbi:hypothetical protein OG204_23125 [Streptomyces sp. NBC_01387]|uniref:hypothetical protein n=1 Tax=Streptomyces sp. NBC_01387 TaxID=2903849 RepID=UPI00324EB6B0